MIQTLERVTGAETVGELRLALQGLSDATPLLVGTGEMLNVKRWQHETTGLCAVEIEQSEGVKWIPCVEQMPGKLHEVAVKNSESAQLGISCSGGRGPNTTWPGVDFPVTHWRPILTGEAERGEVIYG